MDQPADAAPLNRPWPPENGLFSHADDGVNLTVIRWMLSLTPLERLQAPQNSIDAILHLRAYRTER